MIPTSNLGAMLLQTARRLPNRPGLIWRDRVWSWSEIAARACAAAAGLRAAGIDVDGTTFVFTAEAAAARPVGR